MQYCWLVKETYNPLVCWSLFKTNITILVDTRNAVATIDLDVVKNCFSIAHFPETSNYLRSWVAGSPCSPVVPITRSINWRAANWVSDLQAGAQGGSKRQASQVAAERWFGREQDQGSSLSKKQLVRQHNQQELGELITLGAAEPQHGSALCQGGG